MKRKSNLISSIWWGRKLKRVTTKLLVCVCLLASTVSVTNTYAHSEKEQLLKAAYIFNFAKFTQWPENTWKAEHTPLNLCIAGKDKLVNKLGQLAGKTIQKHPVNVLSLKDVQNINNCHLLYIATSEKERYQNILKSVNNEPVLTVSELPNFGHSGGMIEIYREEEQTHFIINLGVTRESGLTISSRLLNLAVVINNEDAQ